MVIRRSVLSLFLGISLAVGLAFLPPCASGDHSVPDAGTAEAATTDVVGPDLHRSDFLVKGDTARADLASNDGSACNNLVNSGPIVQQWFVNQPMPVPTMGGTIVSGTYYLTDSKIYQGAPPGVMPLQLRATQLITANTMQTVQQAVGSKNIYDTRTYYSTSRTALTIAYVCGTSGDALTVDYDATGTNYTTYNNAAKTVDVWTRQ